MDLRTLGYFVAVAQELNITHAAEKLRMSQPPLSHQIQLLEQELGMKLFIRGKRKLKLTEAGELLLRRADQMLNLAEITKQELSELRRGSSGTLNLGMVEGQVPHLSARWISGFRQKYPLVRYSLWNGSSDDVLDRLDKGLAELAVIAAPYDTERLDGIVVGREPWCATISRSDPLAQLPGDTIPLARLAGSPLIVPSRKSRVQAIRQWFHSVDAEPDIMCELSHSADALALVAQGVGIGIFPMTFGNPGPDIVSKVIVEPGRQVEYVLVRNRDQAISGLARAFWEYVASDPETEN